MSSPMPISLHRHRHVGSLDEQIRELGASSADCLVVSCAEPGTPHPAAWQRALPKALQIHSPGASVADADLRDALRYAVQRLGVKEVLVILHSDCSHLHALDDDARSSEASLPLMDRIYAARQRREAALVEARHRVRVAVRQLMADPSLECVSVGGLVHIDESGVMLCYDAARDDFEALL